MNELLRDAIQYWERRRIIYNLILALVFIGWIGLTWPHFSAAPSLQAITFLIVFAIAANVCYSAVYLVDIPMQGSAIRAHWRRWRFGLWLVGTGIAFVFTNYWIADEIYPYAR
jgi:uncharacterized membrane protein YgaE (UPF0421/DUF939 family)